MLPLGRKELHDQKNPERRVSQELFLRKAEKHGNKHWNGVERGCGVIPALPVLWQGVCAIRVLFLIPRAGGGGAQRVMLLLAQHLSQRCEVHLGILLADDAADAVALSAGVHVRRFGARRVRSALWPLWRWIWQLRPNGIVSCMVHLNFLMLMLRPLLPGGTRLMVRQNATASAALANDPNGWRNRILYRLLYPLADLVLCQSTAMAEDLACVARMEMRTMRILPNPVEIDAIRAAQPLQFPWRSAGSHLVAMGRLSPEKGFDLLLRALACLRDEGLQAEVVISGEGPEAKTLRALASSLGIEALVHFPGAVTEPERLLVAADLFVLSSRHEGMPNALLEAAAAGLPLVATPACGGVVELLQGQPGCWLCRESTVDALVAALRDALVEVREQPRYAHGWIEGFRAERVAGLCGQWIEEACSRRLR